jgi:hypothetical protein
MSSCKGELYISLKYIIHAYCTCSVNALSEPLFSHSCCYNNFPEISRVIYFRYRMHVETGLFLGVGCTFQIMVVCWWEVIKVRLELQFLCLRDGCCHLLT